MNLQLPSLLLHSNVPSGPPRPPKAFLVSFLLVWHQVKDGGHGHGLEQAVLILQPFGEAVFGKMFTTEERIPGGGPVTPLNSF